MEPWAKGLDDIQSHDDAPAVDALLAPAVNAPLFGLHHPRVKIQTNVIVGNHRCFFRTVRVVLNDRDNLTPRLRGEPVRHKVARTELEAAGNLWNARCGCMLVAGAPGSLGQDEVPENAPRRDAWRWCSWSFVEGYISEVRKPANEKVLPHVAKRGETHICSLDRGVHVLNAQT